MKLKLLVLSTALFGGAAFAQPAPNGERREPPPEVKAAMEACRTSVSKDANGRPDRGGFESCMTAKGFKKPEGRPEHKGPPQGANQAPIMK